MEILFVKLFNPDKVVKSIKNFIRIALEFEYDLPLKITFDQFVKLYTCPTKSIIIFEEQ